MPNSVSNVGFQSPSFDYSADLEEIERKKALAAMLQQQSMEGPGPTQSVGGMAIRQPMGWGKIAQALAGGLGQRMAGNEKRDLAERSQRDYQMMLAKGLKQLQGSPASALSEDASGNVTPASQAIAPDPAGALGTFGSHPMGAQMVPLAMQELQQQKRMAMLKTLMGGGAPATPPQGGMMPAGGQPPPTGGPNMLAGMPPQVVALMTSGDPEMVKLGTTLLEANKGIAQRPGAPVVNPFTGAVIAQPTPSVPAGVGLQVGPGGPQAYPVPGAQGAMGALTASQAGATEAGKAPYNLQTVQTPGAPTLMTQQQAIEAATGAAMPQPGAQPPAQAPMGTIPPPKPGTPDYDAYKRVRSGEVPSAYVPQKPRAGLPLQGQGEARAEVEIGEGLGKRYTSIQDAGFAANQKMQKLDRLGGLLTSLDTGKMTPAGTELAAWAKSAGIPIGENLDNAQAAKALANEMALELRNPAGGAGMPGAMSDADRNYLQGLIASIDKTPGANKLLLEGMQKLSERDREVAKLAREYKRQNGKFDEGFYDKLAEFSDKNPLFPKSSPKPSAKGLSPQEQQELDTLRKRFSGR